MKQKKPHKKEKFHLIFDEKERNDYLTGFRKRNLERRMKHKQELDKMLKEEKKKIKQNQKEALHSAIISQRQVPEIQHLLEPVTYDLPDHTVTISQVQDMDSINAYRSIDMDKKISSSISAAGKSKDEVEKLRRVIRDLKTNRIKTIQKSSVQKVAKKEQKKKDKQKANRIRRLFQKGLKNTKKKNKKKHSK